MPTLINAVEQSFKAECVRDQFPAICLNELEQGSGSLGIHRNKLRRCKRALEKTKKFLESHDRFSTKHRGFYEAHLIKLNRTGDWLLRGENCWPHGPKLRKEWDKFD
jgi:hypothetical protein